MSRKLTGSKSVHADDRKDQGDVHVGDPRAEMLYEKRRFLSVGGGGDWSFWSFLVVRGFHLDGQCDSEPTHGETHRQVAVAHQPLSASAINQESLKQTADVYERGFKKKIKIPFFSFKN